MAVSFQDIELLVQRLYQPGEDHVLIQQQLQQFQKSEQGWQLADALLASQDPNVRFFGALTFTVKLNGVVDGAFAPVVLQRLKYWFVALKDDTPIVVRKLATTLVTYFLRTPVPWPSPHKDLLSAGTTALLLFSTALADEMGKMDHAQSPLHAVMEVEVVDAVALMTAGLVESKDEALQCFSMWANYAQPLWSTKPALQTLQSLTLPMLDLLDSDEGMIVFTDLLESYTSFFTPSQLDVIGAKLPNIEDSQTCQLVTAFGIATVEKIAEGQYPQVLQALGAVLHTDDASIAVEFWNTFVEYVTDTGQTSATPILSEISVLLWQRMYLPDVPDDEFKTFRQDTADLLSSIYIVLGKDMLLQFVALSTSEDWRAVEAGIYCLNALADNALEYEENDQYVLPLLQQLRGDTIPLRRTIIDMIGQYGALLKRHPQYIPDAVRYLFASLDTLPNVAAKSIYELCSTCRGRLTGDLDAFLQQFKTLEDVYVKEKVAGGIAAIIQALPATDRVAPLLDLLNSLGDGLPALHALVSIGKASQEPEETNSDPDPFWSAEGKIVQDKIISLFIFNTAESLETVCQILRTGFTEVSGPFVFPASVTVDLLQRCTIDTPSIDAVMSTTAALISSRQVVCEPILSKVTSLIQAMAHPSQDPGVSQYCFEIVARLLRRHKDEVVAYSQLQTILSFSLVAIESHDILPKRAALDMWARLIRAGVTAYGPDITKALIRQIAGLGQRSDLDSVNEPLKEIFHLPGAKAWTEDALFNNFPTVRGQIGETEKRRFLAQLVAARGGPKVRDITREFYAMCRGVVTTYS